MRKISAKHLQWLKKELSLLEAEHVISPDTSKKLNTYYAENTQSGLHWAIIVFSIFGALLIGSGIILLFAHNWESMDRPMRAVVSFLPLIAGMVLSAWSLWKNGDTALRESAGVFHSIAVGATIALIGQTYHLPSDTPTFLLIWALLIFPLIFLLRSSCAFLIYSTLSCSWAITSQNTYGQAAGFWILLIPPVLYVIHGIRTARDHPQTLLCSWGLLFAMGLGLGFTLERNIPGLWIVAYSAFFTCAALFGRQFYDGRSGWSNPLQTFGTIGVILLTYLFTWTEFWDDIGWNYYRSSWYYKPWGAWFDVSFTLLLISGWLLASVHVIKKRSLDSIAPALFPVISGTCFLFTTFFQSGMEVLNALILNGFMLFLGIMYICQGCREVTLRKLNGGMAILAALFIARFFDVDFDFLIRGLVFIVMGICFLSINLIMVHRKKQREVSS